MGDNEETEEKNEVEGGHRISLQRQTTEQPLIDVEEDVYTTLTYRLEDKPPVMVTLFTAMQHIFICLPGCLYTASAVADIACVPYSHPVRATLFCGTLFMTGFCTFLQTFIGVRLPIFQGPSAAFLIPLIALKEDPEWRCPDDVLRSEVDITNGTQSLYDTDDQETSLIYLKLQEISGALMLASLFEILMGSVGLLNLLMKFIGPITVAITISLVGVSLVKLPITYARPNFPVALGCMVLILVFVLYCQNIRIPIPRCGKGKKGRENRPGFPVFQLIPILTGLAIMWFFSWILTLAGVFTNDKSSIHYMARTDAKSDVVSLSPWFQISYPGVFGAPKINVALFLGFTISCISSMVESVGDYYAAQNACEVVTPPKHAISRGILVEGLGSLVSGAIGVGHATTSYSGNISILTLSKNASRLVMYTAAGLLMMMSLFGKVGAALTTIPNPVLGGVSIIVHGTLVAIGLANLKHVDMTSTRNLLVVGMPFMIGITVPSCVEMYPDIIDTGYDKLNQVIHVVIGSPMFLGGFTALVLDSTVPGSLKSRGMLHHHLEPCSNRAEKQHIYSWSIYPKIAEFIPGLSYIPFLPKKTPAYKIGLSGGNHEKSSIV